MDVAMISSGRLTISIGFEDDDDDDDDDDGMGCDTMDLTSKTRPPYSSLPRCLLAPLILSYNSSTSSEFGKNDNFPAVRRRRSR